MVIPYYCEDYPEVWDEFNSFWDEVPPNSVSSPAPASSSEAEKNAAENSSPSDSTPLTADVKPSEKLP